MIIRNVANHSESKLTSMLQAVYDTRQNERLPKRLFRFVPLVALLVLIIGTSLSIFSISSLASSLRHKVSQLGLRPSLQTTKIVAGKESRRPNTGREIAGPTDSSFGAWKTAALFPGLKLPVTFAALEGVALFESDCTTPRTAPIKLGDTICARVTGAVGKRLSWVDPTGFIVQSANITTDPQTGLITLPSTTTSTFNDTVVDNRGDWRATITSPAEGSVEVSLAFPCHDVTGNFADVLVYKTFGQAQSSFTVGGNVTAYVAVTNLGPDTATNVQLSDLVPDNATLVTPIAQISGPTFTCSGSTCSIASLARSEAAVFTVVYQLGSGITTSDLTGTAITSTSTSDLDSSNNTGSATVGTAPTGGGGGGCSVVCPADITQNNDPGQTTAVVNYATPSTTGSCGAVTCTPASGSAFSIGTTTVTCSESGGSSCSFEVTVRDTVTITITENGADPFMVECHTSFTDPGATASNNAGTSIPVTASGSVDVNVPGSYTITYTATDGTHTATDTRTVIVADTLPPVITLSGANPMTVECHSVTSFTDPGATAADACVAGPIAVTASGSVNVNVPGTYIISYSASDGTNDVSVTRTVNVVDTTPPTVTCPANVAVYLPLNSPATSMAVSYAAATASDNCSGVTISYSKASGSVFNVGVTTVTVTAADASANVSTCSFTVTVLYNFTGFFQPIDNLPTLNQVNAGRSVPVKFSLSGDKGLNIFATGYPASGVITCGSNDPVVDVTDTGTAGNSSLSFGGDQYVYTWKTESAWAGTCRQLVVKLNDGSEHRANFKFK